MIVDCGVANRPMRAAILHAMIVGLTIALLSCRPTGADAEGAARAVEAQTTAENPEPDRPDSIGAILSDYSGYETVATFEGSISRVNAVETLILINDPSRIRDAGIHETVQRLIWVPKDLREDDYLDALLLSTGYTNDELHMLTPFIESVGSSHPVFGFADLTGDGREELLFLRTHGLGMSLYILTVENSELAYLMAGQADMNVITSMTLVSPPGELPIRFRLEGLRTREGTADDTDTESPWRWAEYGWNAESGEFEVTGSGILAEDERS